MSPRIWARLLMLGLILATTLAAFALVRQPKSISLSRTRRRGTEAPAPPEARALRSPVVSRPSEPKTAMPGKNASQQLLEALKSGDRKQVLEALENLRAEFEPRPVPDAENAAVLYRRAFEQLSEDLGEEEQELVARLSGGFALTSEERTSLQNLLDKSAGVLKLLHEAADRPGCNFNLDYSRGVNVRLDHLSGFIRAGRLLDLEARLADGTAVAEPARASSRLAQALGQEPVFVSKLVQNLCIDFALQAEQRAFGEGASAHQMGALTSSFPPDRLRPGLEKALSFELYTGVKAVMDGLDIVHLGQGLPEDKILPPGSPGTPRWEDPLTAIDLSNYAEKMIQLATIVKRPYHETQDQIAALAAESREGTPDTLWISKSLLPPFAASCESFARTEAALGAGQVAAGLRLYRESHGQYPSTLDDLRDVLPTAPLDPYTGKAFRYRREGGGFVVSSAGPAPSSPGEVSEVNVIEFRSSR